MMAWLAIGFLALWLTVLQVIGERYHRRLDLRSFWNGFRSHALLPFCASLPAFILVLRFLSQMGRIQMGTGTADTPLRAKLFYSFRHLDELIAYSSAQVWPAMILFLLFVGVGIYLLVTKCLRRQLTLWDSLLLVVAGYSYLYFTSPSNVGQGGWMNHRLQLYPFFVLILWFGAQLYDGIVKRGIQVVATTIALLLLGINTVKYAQLNDYMAEYLSGMDLIAPHTTLLPLSFSHQGHTLETQALTLRTKPFLHAAGYIAAQKGVVALDNYAGVLGYFPIIFRPHLNPVTQIGRIESEPPRVDFLSFHQRTGGQVDYVLIWGLRDEFRHHEATQSIFQQLNQGYELIYTSPQRGLMQLYRRKA
jgi:hypothetical protein